MIFLARSDRFWQWYYGQRESARSILVCILIAPPVLLFIGWSSFWAAPIGLLYVLLLLVSRVHFEKTE